MATIELTIDDFDTTIEQTPFLLVDFWADWCPPCRKFGPIFEGASDKHPDLVFAKVDTQAEQQLAGDIGITSIPTLMVFRDGILIYGRPGALNTQAFDEVIAAARAVDMDEVRAQVEGEANPT